MYDKGKICSIELNSLQNMQIHIIDNKIIIINSNKE